MCFEGMLDPDADKVRRREKKLAAGRARYAAKSDEYKKKAREWAAKNPDRARKGSAARQARWRDLNPDAYRAGYRKRKADPKVQRRDRAGKIRRRYGVSEAEYDALLMACCGRCTVCGKDPGSTGRGLCLDHDHATGQARGMLCPACNMSMGLLEESVERLDALKAYILEHRRKANG